jgi:hypothetical protein
MISIYKKNLDLIFKSIVSEGGDGDAIWLTKFVSLEELFTLIELYNLNNNTGWEIIKKENHLLWGNDQEWAIITDDEKFYNKQPDYTPRR